MGVFILIFHIKNNSKSSHVAFNYTPPFFPSLPPLPSEGSGEASYISGKLIPFIF